MPRQFFEFEMKARRDILTILIAWPILSPLIVGLVYAFCGKINFPISNIETAQTIFPRLSSLKSSMSLSWGEASAQEFVFLYANVFVLSLLTSILLYSILCPKIMRRLNVAVKNFDVELLIGETKRNLKKFIQLFVTSLLFFLIIFFAPGEITTGTGISFQRRVAGEYAVIFTLMGAFQWTVFLAIFYLQFMVAIFFERRNRI